MDEIGYLRQCESMQIGLEKGMFTQNGDDLTVNELYKLYCNFIKKKLKKASIRTTQDSLYRHVLPYFGLYKINELTTESVDRWQNILNERDFKHNYKSKLYCTFSALINYGMKFHNITKNVVHLVGNFTNKDRIERMSFWEESEFLQFIAVVDDIIYKTFFSFLYLMGTRKGEALALNWSDLDLSNGTVYISKSINRKGLAKGDGMPYWEITTPKNRSSYRDIVIPPTLIQQLKIYKEYCKKIEGWSEKSFVFGIVEPLANESIRQRMVKYCKKANVKLIRVHDLRHSHASLLINAGQNILIVSQRLGHSDITQTLNTYSHLMPNAQKSIISAINIDLGNTLGL